jgi:hypothetical protein
MENAKNIFSIHYSKPISIASVKLLPLVAVRNPTS